MSEELELSDGTKVTLMTAWMPMSWELQWDDGIAATAAPQLVATMERHRRHRVAYEDSAFGWRAIHCTDCGERLWDVHHAD
jgi:hypothetical protein